MLAKGLRDKLEIKFNNKHASIQELAAIFNDHIMTKSWNEIKKQFKIGTGIFSFFVIFSFIMSPEYVQKDLSPMNVILSKKPIFKETHSKGTNYWAELYFEGKQNKYEINGSDYKYLKYKQFKDSIRVGDRLTVYTKDDNILSLSKNGFEYMDFDKAQL